MRDETLDPEMLQETGSELRWIKNVTNELAWEYLYWPLNFITYICTHTHLYTFVFLSL